MPLRAGYTVARALGRGNMRLNVFKNRSQAPRTVNPRITLGVLAKGARFENT